MRGAPGYVIASLVLLLAVTSTSDARSRHNASANCRHGHSRQIAANAQAQLFEAAQPDGIGVFGCAYRSHRSFLLGEVVSSSSGGSAGIQQETLFGPVAAYEEVEIDERFLGDRIEKRVIIVRDLRSGRIVHRVPTGTPLDEAPQAIGIVVKPSNGATAWLVGTGVSTYQLNVITKRSVRVLASGPIDPSSLNIRGSKLYWTQGGKPMSASLN
jgi:hypothetical protein